MILIGLSVACSKPQPRTTKSQPTVDAPIIDKQLYLSENIAQGQILVMEDDSVWIIRPQDQILCAGWIGNVAITIQNSHNPTYPYALYNPYTETTVLAKTGTIQDLQNK